MENNEEFKKTEIEKLEGQDDEENLNDIDESHVL